MGRIDLRQTAPGQRNKTSAKNDMASVEQFRAFGRRPGGSTSDHHLFQRVSDVSMLLTTASPTLSPSAITQPLRLA